MIIKALLLWTFSVSGIRVGLKMLTVLFIGGASGSAQLLGCQRTDGAGRFDISRLHFQKNQGFASFCPMVMLFFSALCPAAWHAQARPWGSSPSAHFFRTNGAKKPCGFWARLFGMFGEENHPTNGGKESKTDCECTGRIQLFSQEL